MASGACSISTGTVKMTSGTGTCILTASQSGNDNYSAADNVERDVQAAKAASASKVNCPDSVPFDGDAKTPCSATVTGIGGLSHALPVSYTNNTHAGTASASASYAGDDDHNGSDDSTTFTINKAASASKVNCPDSVPFDGSEQKPCTAAVTGAGGLNESLDVTYSDNTNAGTAHAARPAPAFAHLLGRGRQPRRQDSRPRAEADGPRLRVGNINDPENRSASCA
jgi:hypothetical protein